MRIIILPQSVQDKRLREQYLQTFTNPEVAAHMEEFLTPYTVAKHRDDLRDIVNSKKK